MVITKGRREQIVSLAHALAEIAPSTTRGNGFCVQKVAEDMGLKACWKKQNNKRKDIAYLLEHVFRQYPRKPKKLVIEIVRSGVVWMAGKGERVTDEQLAAIAAPMKTLGSPIDKELRRLVRPEPSRVRDPSADKVGLLQNLGLHSALTDDCFEMFKDGHFNESVRKALERFEKLIQDQLGDHRTFGRDLMARAFGEQNPQIALNSMQSANDRSEQEGFKFLTMGAMSGLRNLYSHGDVDQMTATDAIERLAFVSLLFRRVDASLAQSGP